MGPVVNGIKQHCGIACELTARRHLPTCRRGGAELHPLGLLLEGRDFHAGVLRPRDLAAATRPSTQDLHEQNLVEQNLVERWMGGRMDGVDETRQAR